MVLGYPQVQRDVHPVVSVLRELWVLPTPQLSPFGCYLSVYHMRDQTRTYDLLALM